MTKKVKKNSKLLPILIFAGWTLLLVNVLLLDLRGTTFFSKKNFKDVIGVSIENEKSYPKRGTIYDSEGNILATDVTVYKIIFILDEGHQKYVRDSEGNIKLVDDYVSSPETTARLVAPLLKADESYLYERLSEKGLYQVEVGVYGSGLSYDVKEQIEALNLPGIIFESSTSRYYPYNTFASHLLGYAETQQVEDGSNHLVGISGIEGLLDNELTGTEGFQEYYSDVNGYPLAGGMIDEAESFDGYDVKLTLNNIIQQGVETCLKGCMGLSHNTEKAWSIVMDKDGRILGYGSYPSFNPNDMNITDYNDYVSQLPYEPGSTMKTVVYAATIDIGKFDKTAHFNGSTFYVRTDERGKIARGSYNGSDEGGIHNFIDEQVWDATFYEAYCCSYNVGCAVLLEQYIDQDLFIEYQKNFGFFRPVGTYGIDEGDFYGSADYSNSYSIINTSFGQAMSCTALQLVQAYSTFSNGGVMVKPYIIDSITDPNTGSLIYKGQREEVGRVVREESVPEMLDLMKGVVNSGWSSTSAKYKIPGVTVGGKSGTAEVALPTGGYGNLTIHSIMLGMPIDNPEVWVYVAYQDWNPSVAEYMGLVNELERTVATVLGLANKEENLVEENKVIVSELGNYVNHTINYVKPKLDENELVMSALGNGNTIIAQYPAAGTTVISGQKILLLTDGNDITMPNMIGWSRKEVTAFWNLTGISCQLNGYGYVSSQNIEAGTVIDKSITIELDLS